MQSTSQETLGWKKQKLESRVPGEISIPGGLKKVGEGRGQSWYHLIKNRYLRMFTSVDPSVSDFLGRERE